MWRIDFYESTLSYRWLKPANAEEQSKWKSTGFHDYIKDNISMFYEAICTCLMRERERERERDMKVNKNDILNIEMTKK